MLFNIILSIAVVCCIVLIFIQNVQINKLTENMAEILGVLKNHSRILGKHIEFNQYALKIFSRITGRNTTEEEKKDE